MDYKSLEKIKVEEITPRNRWTKGTGKKIDSK